MARFILHCSTYLSFENFLSIDSLSPSTPFPHHLKAKELTMIIEFTQGETWLAMKPPPPPPPPPPSQKKKKTTFNRGIKFQSVFKD